MKSALTSVTEDAVCILIFYAQSGLKCFFFLLVPFFRRWQDGARFEEFMARHAEESRDDLQAMKSLNVFYQVRPDFLYNKCFCDDSTC